MANSSLRTRSKLDTYSRLAQGLKKPLKKNATLLSLGSAFLASLSPVEMINAQCLGGIAGQQSVTPNHSFPLDVDGDAVPDVNLIYTAGFDFLLGGAPGVSVLVNTPSNFVAGPTNGTIDINNLPAGQNFVPLNANRFLCDYNGGSFGNFCGFSGLPPKYIIIKKGASLGFVELDVVSAFVGGNPKVTFNILERGVGPVTTLDLSSTANACASLSPPSLCLGGINGQQSVSPGNPFPLDVDGDAVPDVNLIYTAGFDFLLGGAASVSVLVSAAGNLVAGPTNGNLNINNLPPGQAFVPLNVNRFLCDYNGGSFGNFCGFSGNLPPKYIILKKGGSLGFVQLDVANAFVGGQPLVTFNILERGLGQVTTLNLSSTAAACASLSPALPVEWLYFRALADQTGIQLSWETATEKNNSGFELERSETGQDFKKLTFRPGAGTTTQAVTYGFKDQTARRGKTYFYRLRQINNDGSFTFSDIVQAKITGDRLAVSDVFPNPLAGTTARLTVDVNREESLQISLFDARGQQIRTESRLLEAGSHTFDIDVAGLAAGAYFMKLEAGGESVYRQLVVQ